jgi:DNA polymerase-3 subunit beta
MQLTIEASKLANTLQRVQACVAKRTPMEVYKRVLCEAQDKQLHITGTDLESWIRVSVPAIVEECGKAILPPKELNSIALQTDGDLNLSVTSGSTALELRGEGSHYHFTLMNPSDFAPIEEREVDEWLKVTAGDLIRALRLTIFSVSIEERKFAMRGLLFEAINQTLRVVTTDSKRLSMFDCNLRQPRTTDKVFNALVSSNSCNLLLQNLLRIEPESILQIGINYNSIYFKTDDSLLVSRLTEGRFPPYRDVVPKLANLNPVKLNRKAFLASLERLRMMWDDECRRISMNFNGTQINMRILHTRLGEGQVIHKLEHPVPLPVVIHFDPEFLLELFRIQEFGDNVTMFYKDASRSSLFVSDRYTHLIVPLT